MGHGVVTVTEGLEGGLRMVNRVNPRPRSHSGAGAHCPGAEPTPSRWSMYTK